MKFIVFILLIYCVSSVFASGVTIEFPAGIMVGEVPMGFYDDAAEEKPKAVLNLSFENSPLLHDEKTISYTGKMAKYIAYDLEDNFYIWNFTDDDVFQHLYLTSDTQTSNTFPINLDGSFVYDYKKHSVYAYNPDEYKLYKWFSVNSGWQDIAVLAGLGNVKILSYKILKDTTYLEVDQQGIFALNNGMNTLVSPYNSSQAHATFINNSGIYQVLPKYTEEVVNGEVQQKLEDYQYALFNSNNPEVEFTFWGINRNVVTDIKAMDVNDGMIFIFSGANKYFQIRFLATDELKTARIKTINNLAQFLGYFPSAGHDLFWVRTTTGVDQVYEWVNSRFELDFEFSAKSIDIEIGNDVWTTTPNALMAIGTHRLVAYKSSDHAYLAHIYKRNGPSGVDALMKEYIADKYIWMFLNPNEDANNSFSFGVVEKGVVGFYQLKFPEFIDSDSGTEPALKFESIINRENQFEEGETQLDYTEIASDASGFVQHDSRSNDEVEDRVIKRAELSGNMDSFLLLSMLLTIGRKRILRFLPSPCIFT